MIFRSLTNWGYEIPFVERPDRLPLILFNSIGFKKSYFCLCSMTISERGFMQRRVVSLSLQDSKYFNLSLGSSNDNCGDKWFIFSYKQLILSLVDGQNRMQWKRSPIAFMSHDRQSLWFLVRSVRLKDSIGNKWSDIRNLVITDRKPAFFIHKHTI